MKTIVKDLFTPEGRRLFADHHEAELAALEELNDWLFEQQTHLAMTQSSIRVISISPASQYDRQMDRNWVSLRIYFEEIQEAPHG